VYRIEIDGRPQLRCEIDLDVVPEIGMDSGLVATAMRAINAIPWIVDARPGVLNPMEVPVRPTRNPRPGGQPLEV
jgi:4-hydroxy-tetrahydrodipicolinate reductase